MKIKCSFLTTLLLAVTTVAFAQKKKTTATTPNIIVKNLYAAQKAGKGPFLQTKNRALVDVYFTKDLADMIWKDAVGGKGRSWGD